MFPVTTASRFGTYTAYYFSNMFAKLIAEDVFTVSSETGKNTIKSVISYIKLRDHLRK